MHEEFKDKRGVTGLFTDDGIWHINPQEIKDTANSSDKFFPYGSITEIRFGRILSYLTIFGTKGDGQRVAYFDLLKEQKPQIKELVRFAEEKRKTAQRADVIERDYRYLHIDSEPFWTTKERNERNLYFYTSQSHKVNTTYEEFKNERGGICIFMDDGVWIFPGDDTCDTYFPYGSIKEIDLGLFSVLSVTGTQGEKEKTLHYVTDKEQRPQIQALINFAKSKMKTAPRADYIEKFFRHPHFDAERFYEECNKQDLQLTKNSSRADIEIAKLIAQQNQLTIPADGVVETYLLGESEIARVALSEHYETLFSQAKESEKYASYHGRDKDIFVAQEMVDFYTAMWEFLAFGKALPLQKEHDWALMGGIASGLAGGAAGIAIASDLQAKNAAIRDYNNQLREDYVRAILPTLTEVGDIKTGWEKKLKKAKIALVDDTSPDDLFKSIKFSNERAQILDDGSVLVTVEAKIPTVKIYDTVNAHIDGTLTAKVSQNGKIIAEAVMIIPLEGQPIQEKGKAYTKYLLAGACYGKAEKDALCKIDFQCRELWAIER